MLGLFEARDRGFPLVIDTVEGGERLMAEFFRLKSGGIVFADIGWPEASSHPFHVIRGKARETEDGWAVGEHPVRIAFAGEQLFADWKDWQAWRASPRGLAFDRQCCLKDMRAQGFKVDD
jgi:hypothetical protein